VEYSNRPIPEGINTSPRHPLRELFKLLLVVGGGLLLLFAALGMSAGWLAEQIPFHYEVELLSDIKPDNNDADEPAELAYLQDLVARLVVHMDLPAEMIITTHYVDTDEVNANAGFAGHLNIYRGLIEKVPHENALALALAHEIGHVKLRHPMRSMGRLAVAGLAVAALAGTSGNTLGPMFIGEANELSRLSYSRSQEAAADAEGLAAIVGLYGHANGATDLFEMLKSVSAAAPGGVSLPAFGVLQDHPLDEDRIAALNQLIEQHGWSTDGPTTAIKQLIVGAKTVSEPESATPESTTPDSATKAKPES
jgi:predicted Zn-dependent protease